MKKTMVATTLAAVFALTACGDNKPVAYAKQQQAAAAPTAETKPAVTAENPLLKPSALQYQAPEFDKIKTEHFMPAMEQGIAEHDKEIEAIANNPEAATFENTIAAMEKSGALLNRATSVFFNLTGTVSTPEIMQIQSDITPKLSVHGDNISLNPKLFARVKAIYDNRASLNLDPESLRLTEVTYEGFVRSGALLNDEQKATIRALNEEESKLGNQFSQNLLKLNKEIAVFVKDKAELKGMSDAEVAAAAEQAKSMGRDGEYVIQITNTTRQPALAVLENRELRQRVWEASAYRGTKGELDNRPLVSRLAQIRAQRAKLLGFDNYANYSLDQAMAKKPEAVYNMLQSMVPAVVANAKAEAADIQAMIKQEGGNFELQAWDWEFYAEKVRKAK